MESGDSPAFLSFSQKGRKAGLSPVTLPRYPYYLAS
jgi:hypothetical protein